MISVVNMIPRSRSDEAHQDSEPFLTVNRANPLQIVGTAFTPDPMGGPLAPVYVSTDGGQTWRLNSIVPGANTGAGTGDITVGFAHTSGMLYAAILRGDASLRMNILRTPNALAPTPMTVLVDRPQVDQPFVHAVTVANGVHANEERVYVGDNDFAAGGGMTATIDLSLNAGINKPKFRAARLELRGTGTAGQNGPAIRPTVHADGTIYGAFYGWRAFNQFTKRVIADVVVVRDDVGGGGVTPFRSLVDPDAIAGLRVATGVQFTWDVQLGQQRLGGDLSIAVDPRDSATVYLAWGDEQNGTYTLHVRRSTDRGVTWSTTDLRTLPNAINPALAINTDRVVGLLYQRLTGAGNQQQWTTHFERTSNGTQWNDTVLARVPAGTPIAQFQPYLGDYDFLLAVDKAFYGIFCASNIPDLANFPNGVTYQRNADFNTRRLLGLNGTTVVRPSIDPFFFQVTD